MSAGSDSSFEERWRQRFERYAAASDDDAGIAGWSAGGLATRYRRFTNLWNNTSQVAARGERWLDAGCGAGTYTRFLSEQGLKVTAVDYSAPTTHKARERSPGEIDWAVADVTHLPFRDRCFDGALCFGVMQALASPEAALRELRRVLRPGGTLWVDALNSASLPSAIAERARGLRGDPPHLRYDAPGDFRAAMRASGFAAIDVFWVPIMPSRLRFLQPLAESAPVRALLRLVPLLGSWCSHSFLVHARAGEGVR